MNGNAVSTTSTRSSPSAARPSTRTQTPPTWRTTSRSGGNSPTVTATAPWPTRARSPTASCCPTGRSSPSAVRPTRCRSPTTTADMYPGDVEPVDGALDGHGPGGRAPQLSLGGGTAARRHRVLRGGRAVRRLLDQPSRTGRSSTRRTCSTPNGIARDPARRITSAPSSAQTGQTITVTTGRPVSSFVLMRYGEATHTVDNDQRRIPLPIVSSAETPTVWPSPPTQGSRCRARTCCSPSTPTARRASPRRSRSATPAPRRRPAPTAAHRRRRAGGVLAALGRIRVGDSPPTSRQP